MSSNQPICPNPGARLTLAKKEFSKKFAALRTPIKGTREVLILNKIAGSSHQTENFSTRDTGRRTSQPTAYSTIRHADCIRAKHNTIFSAKTKMMISANGGKTIVLGLGADSRNKCATKTND